MTEHAGLGTGETGQNDAPADDLPDDLSELAIGPQIRDLRKAKRLTLSELAGRIDRSVGYLSQLERGLSTITITGLQQIASALEVQVSWFFQGGAAAPPEERDIIVRRNNRRRLYFNGSDVTEELLSPNLSGEIEMILTTFEPGGRTGERGRLRRGEEAGLVISGTLDIETEERTYRLNQGDSFTFRKDGHHSCHNPGNVDAVVLWVYAPASY